MSAQPAGRRRKRLVVLDLSLLSGPCSAWRSACPRVHARNEQWPTRALTLQPARVHVCHTSGTVGAPAKNHLDEASPKFMHVGPSCSVRPSTAPVQDHRASAIGELLPGARGAVCANGDRRHRPVPLRRRRGPARIGQGPVQIGQLKLSNPRPPGRGRRSRPTRSGASQANNSRVRTRHSER